MWIKKIAWLTGAFFLLTIVFGYGQVDMTTFKQINLNDAQELGEVQVNDLFESVEYIILDEQEEYIGGIQQLLWADHSIYIVDEFGPKVLQYSLSGDLKNTYSSTGVGPHEVGVIDWIDLNPSTGELEVYDQGQRKIVYLDHNLNFLRSQSCPVVAHSMMSNDRGETVFFVNELPQSEVEKKNVFVWDKQKVIAGFLPIDERYSLLSYDFARAFSRYRNEVQFFQSFRPEIYAYTSGNMRLKYQLAGDIMVSKEEVAGKIVKDLFSYLPENKKMVLRDFFEFEETLVLNITDFRKQPLVFFNKNNGDVFWVNGIAPGKDFFVNPIAKNAGQLIGFLPGETIPEVAEFFEQNRLENRAIEQWKKQGKRGAIIMLGKIKSMK